MKTSHKILFAVAGLVFLLTLVGAWQLRLEVKALATQKQSKYRSIDLQSAPTLYLWGKWQITIQQGNKAQLSLAKTEALPVVKNTQEKLQLKASGETLLEAKITLPTLRHLHLANGAQVVLQGFQTDSLNVHLTSQDSFTAKGNELGYLKVNSPR